MLKILVTPGEILWIPEKGLGCEVLGNHWSDITFRKSHKCFSISCRLPQSISLTVSGKGGELKYGMFEQPVDNYIIALISYKRVKTISAET